MDQDANMDLDDEPSPWQLERLVFSSSEIDHEPSDGLDEDQFWHSPEASLVLDTERFSAKLNELLDTISEDDPLLQATQGKPSCVPIPEGESGPPPSTVPIPHDTTPPVVPANPEPAGHPFTIREVPGKGLGVIATRRIPAGSILLIDPPVLSVHEPAVVPQSPSSSSSSSSSLSSLDHEEDGAAAAAAAAEKEEVLLLRLALLQLAGQYAGLRAATRRQLAGLHAHAGPGARRRVRAALGPAARRAVADLAERLYLAFGTNEFSRAAEAGGSSRAGRRPRRTRRLFLTTSRINHSCRPCARSSETTDGRRVVAALRDVEAGEEVTLRYLDHHRYARGEWREATQRMWGFVCNCRGCADKADGC